MSRDPKVLVTGVLLTICFSTIVSFAQAPYPFVGTWQLNPTKSAFGNPSAAYKNSTLKIAAADTGQKIIVDNIGGSGRPIRYQFTAKYDGKDYPIEGMAGTVALKRIDARTIERVHKSDGEITLIFVTRVSPDGKTLTLTQTGSADGSPVKNTLVYDRK